jgi:3-oxoacyl-[acyl-carrier protein] reductase
MGGSEILQDKVAIVTGSASGLGASIARALAEQHAQVVINYRSGGDEAEKLVKSLHRSGPAARAIRADVTDESQARQLVDRTIEAFGRLDILVNAVGSFSWKPVSEMDYLEWRAVLASNLDSVFHVCRLAVPHMRKARFGRIVNLGSVGAELSCGQPRTAAFSAAKAGVVAFSRALALEEARNGITVNVVSPGIFTTEDAAAQGPAEPASAHPEDRVPVGRVGSHADVVRAVLFFLDPGADFVTGQVLAVSGGGRS